LSVADLVNAVPCGAVWAPEPIESVPAPEITAVIGCPLIEVLAAEFAVTVM